MKREIRSEHGYINSRRGIKSREHGVVVKEIRYEEVYTAGSKELAFIVRLELPFSDISVSDLVSWVGETFGLEGDLMSVFGVAGYSFVVNGLRNTARCMRLYPDSQTGLYMIDIVVSLRPGSVLYSYNKKDLQAWIDDLQV